MIISISAIIAMSTLYFTFTEDISAQLEGNVFVTHTGGIIKTTGEIIDPVYSTLLDPEYTESTVEFDPMEYLREFNYGKVSQLLLKTIELWKFPLVYSLMCGHSMVLFQVQQ